MGQLVRNLPMGPPIVQKYANTYDRNYKVMDGPEYTSAWHLVKVESLVSNEEVELEYKSRNLQYYSNKSLTHTMPNFGESGSNLKTNSNADLNPFHFHKTKWENGRAELAYSVTETELDRWHLTKIKSNQRNEVVNFIYEEDGESLAQKRGEILDDYVCKRIEVERNNQFFKGWQFTYEIPSVSSTLIHCDEIIYENNIAGIPPVVSTPEEFKFNLGDLHDLTFTEINTYKYFSVSFACLNFTIRASLPFNLTELIGNHRTHLSEFGSLIEVKALSGRMVQDDLDEELELFDSERKRTFLLKVEELDRNWNVNVMDEETIHDFIPSISYINQGDLPKRFSLNQDVHGYYTLNNVSGSPLPRLEAGTNYFPITGSTMSDAVLNKHYGFFNENVPGSIDNMFEGQADPSSYSGFNNTYLTAYGALSLIRTASGSSLSYEYEPNKLPSGEDGGGIRVKQLTENPGDSPAKVTSYTYEGSTVADDIIRAFQSPYNYYYKEKNGTVLEQRVTTSSSSLNRLWPNRSGYIGYKTVTESWNGVGRVEHDFSTPDNIPHYPVGGHFYLAPGYRYYHDKRKTTDVNNIFISQDYDDFEPPSHRAHSQLKFGHSYIGLETASRTYNNDGDIVQETGVHYTCTSPWIQPLEYFVSEMYQYNYQGSHADRFKYRLFKGYKPFGGSALDELFSHIVDLILGTALDHPFKRIERNYMVKKIRVRPMALVADTSWVIDHYPNQDPVKTTTIYCFDHKSLKNSFFIHDTIITLYPDGNVTHKVNIFAKDDRNSNGIADLSDFYDDPQITLRLTI